MISDNKDGVKIDYAYDSPITGAISSYKVRAQSELLQRKQRGYGMPAMYSISFLLFLRVSAVLLFVRESSIIIIFTGPL